MNILPTLGNKIPSCMHREIQRLSRPQATAFSGASLAPSPRRVGSGSFGSQSGIPCRLRTWGAEMRPLSLLPLISAGPNFRTKGEQPFGAPGRTSTILPPPPSQEVLRLGRGWGDGDNRRAHLPPRHTGTFGPLLPPPPRPLPQLRLGCLLLGPRQPAAPTMPPRRRQGWSSARSPAPPALPGSPSAPSSCHRPPPPLRVLFGLRRLGHRPGALERASAPSARPSGFFPSPSALPPPPPQGPECPDEKGGGTGSSPLSAAASA
jgi:hypothetical protein